MLCVPFVIWFIVVDERWPPFWWFLAAAIIMPTPFKIYLRAKGYDVDPYRYRWF